MSKQVATRIISLQATAFNIGKAAMTLQGLPLPGTVRKKWWGILNIHIHICLAERVSDDNRNPAFSLMQQLQTSRIKSKVNENYLTLRIPDQEVNSDQRLFLKIIDSRVFPSIACLKI